MAVEPRLSLHMQPRIVVSGPYPPTSSFTSSSSKDCSLTFTVSFPLGLAAACQTTELLLMGPKPGSDGLQRLSPAELSFQLRHKKLFMPTSVTPVSLLKLRACLSYETDGPEHSMFRSRIQHGSGEALRPHSPHRFPVA